jgi:Mrp family chromosome partitioning ATPase
VTPPKDIAGYLGGTCRPEDILFSIGIDHLTLAASAVRDERASELLATGRLYELLTYIRKVSTRPLVLVDMPPVLNTDDALVVAPQLDAMLLVVGEGRTRRDGLERAMELLVDFNLAGVVLNHSRESLQEYYGGNYGAP